jgi:hypothetical protein
LVACSLIFFSFFIFFSRGLMGFGSVLAGHDHLGVHRQCPQIECVLYRMCSL